MAISNRFFLAASHYDATWANVIVEALRQRGHDVWYDGDSLTLSQDFVTTLRQEAGSRDFIVLVSPSAMASRWIQMEMTVALQNSKRIIPVVIEPTEITGLLAHRAYVDAIGKLPEQVVVAIELVAHQPQQFSTEARALPAQTSVFLSHASEDEAVSRRFKQDLEIHGAYVWADFDEISTGDFYAAINDGLSKCNWLIVLVSPRALKPDKIVIREEVNAALGMRHTGEMHGVIPVVIEAFELRSMPPIWRNLHRYYAIEDYTGVMNKLCMVLGLA